MKPKYFLFGLLCCGMSLLRAQSVIATYTANQNSAAQAAANATAQPLIRGAGLSASGNSTFNSRDWNLNTHVDSAVAHDDYIEWSLQADAGYQIQLSSVEIAYDRSNQGPQQVALRSVLDNYSSNLFLDTSVAITSETNFFSLSLNSSVGGLITFRLYGFQASGSSGTFDIEGKLADQLGLTDIGITLRGSITAAAPAQVELFGGNQASALLTDQREEQVVQQLSMAVMASPAELTSLQCELLGSHQAGDLQALNLYLSPDSLFDALSDSLLASTIPPAGPGQVTFNNFLRSAAMAVDDTAYLFITATLNCGAGSGNSLLVDTISSAQLGFSASALSSGLALPSAAHQLLQDKPLPPAGLSIYPTDSSALVNWSAGIGCRDSVMLLLSDQSFSGLAPMPGQAYLADSCFGAGGTFDGGNIVYHGTANTMELGCLLTNTLYYLRAFAFNGDSVSLAADLTFETGTVQDTGLIITAIFDATLPGGGPKGIELYALKPVPDLSIYGLGLASNGNASNGEEYSLPAGSMLAGDFLYLTKDTAKFRQWFGFAADHEVGQVFNFNGDDALELFANDTTVIDQFGVVGEDGTGEPWEYTDGWAYRRNGTLGQRDSFQLDRWFFSGPNALDAYADNQSAGLDSVPRGFFRREGRDFLFSGGSWSPFDPSLRAGPSDHLQVAAAQASLSSALVLASVEILPGASLDLQQYELQLRDSLILRAGASGYGMLSGAVAGPVVVERYLSSDRPARWFNLAWSVSASLDDIALENGAILRSLVETGGDTSQVNCWWYNPKRTNANGEGSWQPVASLAATTDTAAYSVFMGAPYFGNLPLRLSARGALRNGNVAWPVSTANQGWNFVANPYPTALNWDQLFADNADLNANYYVFSDDSDSSWWGYNALAGGPDSSQSPPIAIQQAGQHLAPGQGFFVKAINSMDSLQFNNAQRSLLASPTLYKAGKASGLYLYATTSDTLTDYCYLGFKAAASDQPHPRWDGSKKMNSARRVPNLYLQLFGHDYMYKFINEQWSHKTIPLELSLHKAGKLELSALLQQLDPGWQIELEWPAGQERVDLRKAALSLQHPGGGQKLSLLLHINKGTVGLADHQQTELYVYREGEQWLLHSGEARAGDYLRLLDASGRLVKKQDLSGGETLVSGGATLPQGVYLLEVLSKGQTIYRQKLLF